MIVNILSSKRVCGICVAILWFVTDLPQLSGGMQERSSNLVNDDTIWHEVNEGFTVTEDDRKYLEHMRSEMKSGGPEVDVRIVAGEEAALGNVYFIQYLQLEESMVGMYTRMHISKSYSIIHLVYININFRRTAISDCP